MFLARGRLVQPVMKLPYLDAVFHEATRVFPPVTFFVNRTCTQDCVIEGLRFEKGVQFGVNVLSVHYDPENWPEPKKFLPERFINKKSYHAMSWMPFEAGPRNCTAESKKSYCAETNNAVTTGNNPLKPLVHSS
ncbi:hypothetical protein L596_025854 [Steinernema carpocapsae]|uniref:Cytochrome P450 n=1 Tax=Steinernema carpocapsae TaxID=34508 RepID=A0A4U5M8Y8_STECR|nr:hypothetical protein L596_025854 [Steinernema carpocapsae]